MSPKKYRDSVCAVIRKRTGNSVLIFHRKGSSENSGWQFPQGGIDIKKDLFEEFLETRKELRLVGVRVTGLKPAEGEKKEAKLGKWLGKQA